MEFDQRAVDLRNRSPRDDHGAVGRAGLAGGAHPESGGRPRPVKRVLGLTLAAVLIPVLIVEAHAALIKAVPEPESVVASDLKEIHLTFDEPIEAGSSIILF